MKAVIDGLNIVFNLQFFENHLAQAVGARWHSGSRTHRAKATKLTASAVVATFKPEDIDPAIIELAGVKEKIPELAFPPSSMVKVVTPRSQQLTAVSKAWPHSGFAVFHVMGCGKSLTTIIIANLRRAHDLIDRMLIVCPTSVKGVWGKEFGRYSSMEQHVHILEAGGKMPAKWTGFPILVVGVEGLSQGGSFKIAQEFVAGGRCLSVVDESSRIKNHDAGRTEKCWELGEESAFRMVLTGSNVTQGIQDLYAQMRFVDPTIIGELSYYSFRNKYCVMGGFEQRKIIGYKQVEELFVKIRPFCDVIRKQDMKDLPPKTYQIRDIKASPEQVRACKELAREMKTELGDKEISVANALEAMLRFQQIAGGFDPDGTPLSSNPKMAELLALLEEFDGKAIIWARYLPEIAAITSALEKAYPGAVLSLYGAVASASRQAMVDEFQSNPAKRFFVSNQATGGIGITLTAATLSVYYSNTFSLEDRLQSEDRNHRIGQMNAVLYVDLISDLKVDRTVMMALSQKKSVADFVGSSLKVNDLI